MNQTQDHYQKNQVSIDRDGKGFRARLGDQFSPILPLTLAWTYFDDEQ